MVLAPVPETARLLLAVWSIGLRPTFPRTEPQGMACQFDVFTREDRHG
jgi:hypothetical protein